VAPKAPGEGFVPQTPRHRHVATYLRKFARSMRHEQTDAEAAMWRLLQDRRLSAYKFRRQVPFKSYILDFVCFEKRMVIEIDGSQHADLETDSLRAAMLATEGFETARYWNNDVLQQRVAVLEDIPAKLAGR
jgi:very-short-patch-repair endonuclease